MGIDMVLKADMRRSPEATRRCVREFFQALKPVIPYLPPVVQEGETETGVSLIHGHWFTIGFTEDTLTVDARTNVLGPGYHDYLVRTLDGLGKKAGLRWQSDGEGSGDETGYWDSRDFAALRKSMVAWLSSLASVLPKLQGREIAPDAVVFYKTPPAICMMSPLPLAEYEICHPQGPLTWDAVARFAVEEPDEEDLGRFFMWWERSEAPTFFRRQWRHPASLYRNFALFAMWNHITWQKPEGMEEGRLAFATLECLETAWRKRPDDEYPVAEWVELAESVNGAEVAETVRRRFPGRADAGARIGYLRHDIVWRYGKMMIKLPGAMHMECVASEPDTYWNERIRLRITAFRRDDDGDGKPVGAAEWFAGEKVREALAEYEPFAVVDSRVMAKIRHCTLEETDGSSVFVSTLLAVVDDGYAMQLFAYYGDEKTREEAEGLFRGIAYSS